MRNGRLQLLRTFPLSILKLTLTGNPDHLYHHRENCRQLLFGGDRGAETEKALSRILAQPESHRVLQDLFKIKISPAKKKLPTLVMGGGKEIGLPVSLFESQARLYSATLQIQPELVHEAIVMLDWAVLASNLETWLKQTFL